MFRAFVLSGASTSLLAFVRLVVAQGTNATCLESYDWMSNSLGQSPCLVAAFMNSPCFFNPQDSFVIALPPNTAYPDPTTETADDCVCNSPLYSVLQACAICQGISTNSWSSWTGNCDDTFSQIYPFTIPFGTAIPDWAYLDVISTDNFDVNDAFLDSESDAPDSTAFSVPPSTSASSLTPATDASTAPAATDTTASAGPPSPSADSSATSPSTSSSVTPSFTVDPSPTSNSNNDSSSGSSGSSHFNVDDAIIGGVIGAIVVVAFLIAFICVLKWCRKPRSRAAASPYHDNLD